MKLTKSGIRTFCLCCSEPILKGDLNEVLSSAARLRLCLLCSKEWSLSGGKICDLTRARNICNLSKKYIIKKLTNEKI